MPTFDMRSYARRGAETRIEELKQELEAIYGAFPELREGSSRRRGRPAGKVVVNHEEQITDRRSGRGAAVSAADGAGVQKARRRRRKMSAAQRKAVGERMRKYWAARKGEAAAKKK